MSKDRKFNSNNNSIKRRSYNLKTELEKLKDVKKLPKKSNLKKQVSEDSFEDFAALENKIKNNKDGELVEQLIDKAYKETINQNKNIEEKQKPELIEDVDKEAKLLEAYLLQFKEEIENDEIISEADSIPISSIKNNFNIVNSPSINTHFKKKIKKNKSYMDPFSKTLDAGNEYDLNSPKNNDSLRDIIEKNKQALKIKKERIKHYGRVKKRKNKSVSKKLTESKHSKSQENQISVPKSPFLKAMKKESELQFSIENMKKKIQISSEIFPTPKLHFKNQKTSESELPLKKAFTMATGEQESKTIIKTNNNISVKREGHFTSIANNNVEEFCVSKNSASQDEDKDEVETGENNIKLRRRNTRRVDKKRKSKLKDLNMKIKNEFGKEKDLKKIKLVSKIDNIDINIDSSITNHISADIEDNKISFPFALKKINKPNIPLNNQNEDDDFEIKEYLESLK